MDTRLYILKTVIFSSYRSIMAAEAKKFIISAVITNRRLKAVEK
jgi:hypothetical protein